jgi:hypothetical protein
MKAVLKPLGEHLPDIVTELLSSPESLDHVVTSVLCPDCGQSWGLRFEEDAQFLHVHRCLTLRHKPAHVVRVLVERIGETPAERESLAASWQRRLAGYVRIRGEDK